MAREEETDTLILLWQWFEAEYFKLELRNSN